MEQFARVAVLRNNVEAGLLDSILSEREIPHIMVSYHDAALDGLFQAQKGWGCVEAPESYKDEIVHILADIREQADEASSGDEAP